VKGTLPGVARTVNVLIDTGATATLINRKLARTAALRNLPPLGVTLTAFGLPLAVERVVIDDLRLGGRIITRSCLAADLGRDDIDIILGLDVLRGTSLTIDYEHSKLRFGASSSKAQSAVLEEEEGLLVVPVTLNGKTMRLAVDTGAHITVIYQESCPVGNRRTQDEKLVTIAHSGGATVARQFTLYDLQVGEAWIGRTSLAVLTIDNNQSTIDGFLGTASLGLKRVHLDFELQALRIES
jgi:predicted aspartyl protease